uniref:Uncharacterized protein n=1 Tax=Anguilla anguilla TaxID=7936 RepID=A0A0E9TQN7_ANGAN
MRHTNESRSENAIVAGIRKGSRAQVKQFWEFHFTLNANGPRR